MTLFFPDIVWHGDDAGMGFWLSGHFYEHRAMVAVGLGLTPVYTIPDYDLFAWDPASPDQQRGWLEAHALVHDSLRQLTGISGPDYAEVDFANKRQFDEWMVYHAGEHQALRQALGLT